MDGETLKAESDINRAKSDIATNKHKQVIDNLLREIDGLLTLKEPRSEAWAKAGEMESSIKSIADSRN